MKTIHPILAGILLPGWLWAARPLTESTFTQVINDVKVLAEASRTPAAAKLNELFKAPDLLRTGGDSLAELTAADQTITRVGANTVFSFEANGRNVNLEQGSVLFHSPKGRGGGTIKTRSASAAVLGTTIIVVATANGGFKAILLEGRGQVRLPNGNYRILQAGQLVFILPGGTSFGPVLNFNLGTLVRASRLVNGFQGALPSMEKITAAVTLQTRLIETGKAEDTGLLAGDNATKDQVQVVNSSLLERAVGETRLDRAARTDAIINSSTLDLLQVFRDKLTLRLPQGDVTTPGFVGRNVTIITPFIDLDAFTDGNLPGFKLIATGDLSIKDNPSHQLAFGGSVNSSAMSFETVIGGATGVNIAPGMLIEANGVGDFTIFGGTSISFANISVFNQSMDRGVEVSTVIEGTGRALGDISLVNNVGLHASFIDVHGRDVTLQNSLLGLQPTSPAFSPTAHVSASADLHLSSLSVSGPTGSSAYFAAGNNVLAGGGTFTGLDFLEMKAGNNLTVSGPQFSSPISSVIMKAGNILSVVSPQFLSGVSSINLDARTIVLQNVNIPNGTSVLLRSQSGFLAAFANTGAAVVPGDVNFVSGVMFNGVPFPSNPTPLTGTLSSSSVTIAPLP